MLPRWELYPDKFRSHSLFAKGACTASTQILPPPQTDCPHLPIQIHSMPELVRNSFGPDLVRYIERPKIEAKLLELFGRRIQVKLQNGHYVFDAPREVTRVR
ncbi:uncharacterized protein BP01DRAFT_92029 [Aspergillus saccharolyticus JOP 1030-1]|uniref:Uncharacterized protein n=1 Tax=Aspergillus saccharolyticus JOP 1030-1 TaxID=1450539 RepID=A0A318ZJP3_9EURO|nr:hypothetical protein BP01DRAFT_92029 [Aspergillus saccharolyticus JOP 1030-1]PYH43990.1 hypothetical protein BP01DRAFT_92029 [Aspergillus saccharolyticus JOP 1030-1]